MKPAETAQVEFIKDCLRKGEQRKVILEKFGKRWKDLGRSTFDNRLKVAKQQVAAEIKTIEAKAGESVAAKAEAMAGRIISVTQRQELLSRIATGQVLVKKPVQTKKGLRKVACEPDHVDRIRAISELNKMGGDHAAIRHKIGGDEDNPAPIALDVETNIDYSKLSTEVLEALLNARTDQP